MYKHYFIDVYSQSVKKNLETDIWQYSKTLIVIMNLFSQILGLIRGFGNESNGVY